MTAKINKKQAKARSGRSNPINGTKESINGYPKSLIIYKVNGSEFYYARYFYLGKYFGKSTKTVNKTEAKKEAIRLYQDVILNARENGITSKSSAFSIVGKNFIDGLKSTSKASLYRNDSAKFKNDLLPFFGDKDVSKIKYSDINNFLDKISDRGISNATKKHFLVVIRKILKYAVVNGLMNSLPEMPKIKGSLPTVQKRDYLTHKEYLAFGKAIEKHCKDVESKKTQPWSYRNVPVTMEIKHLVQFMVNSFIRPSDIRVLKHTHVKEQFDASTNTRWLTLSHPATKTVGTEVQTMPVCVPIYEKLVEFQKANKTYDPKGFVFMPQYKNRNTAMGVLGKLFAEVVKKTNVEEITGKNITLYSLRHTAIMFRLIKGEIDSISLARNSRTSAQVIDRFYGAHLTTMDVRKKLHSFRK